MKDVQRFVIVNPNNTYFQGHACRGVFIFRSPDDSINVLDLEDLVVQKVKAGELLNVPHELWQMPPQYSQTRGMVVNVQTFDQIFQYGAKTIVLDVDNDICEVLINSNGTHFNCYDCRLGLEGHFFVYAKEHNRTVRLIKIIGEVTSWKFCFAYRSGNNITLCYQLYMNCVGDRIRNSISIVYDLKTASIQGYYVYNMSSNLTIECKKHWRPELAKEVLRG